MSFLDFVVIVLVILWVMSLSHLPFCGFCVCRTEFYGFHSCHTSWFVSSVSVTHSCIDCMYIVLVGAGVLFLSHIIVWVPCISLLLVYRFCVHHIIVWIPSLSCWICGFSVPQNFVGSVFWSYICMSSMLITLGALWVLCLSHIVAWVWCLSRLLVCGFSVLEL